MLYVMCYVLCTMSKQLTKRQKEILNFITQFSEEKGYAPSYREIGEYFELRSPATIHDHIQALKNKGYLKASFNEARSMELIAADKDFSRSIDLPLLGIISAGEPIEAVMQYETVAVPAEFRIDRFNSYVLKVKGESMIEEGILDGDYVIIERNPSPKNGDVVVALLNNAYVTLKKFYREANRIRLQPANSKMKPIYSTDPLIQGVVKGVIRKFA